jgi:hypothetical protein
MSTQHTDVQTETRCLLQALIPMTDDDPPRWFAKTMALILMVVWIATIFDLGPSTAPRYVEYGMTALLFLIIGRLWRLEIQKIGIAGILGGTDAGQQTTDDSEDN